MPNNSVPRYRPTYREDEVRLIVNYATRGESLGLMGLAGVGKSNMVNYLRSISRQKDGPGEQTGSLLFPVVDATYWQDSPAHLWKMMLDALHQATRDLPLSAQDSKILSIDEEERTLNSLQTWLGHICQEMGHKVMFVLDDFDIIFEKGPLTMLERLNGLRSEGNRGLLSYLVFTKRLPHVLGRSYDLENRSKFYDLFRHQIYALEPYTQEDARQMLMHLNENAGKPLRTMELTQVRQLAGGHGRLLKIIFDLCLADGLPETNPVDHFAGHSDVRQECQRILKNLHEDEQQAAVRAARGQSGSKDRALLDHLVRRGLLVTLEPPTWFSPVWELFLNDYD